MCFCEKVPIAYFGLVNDGFEIPWQQNVIDLVIWNKPSGEYKIVLNSIDGGLSESVAL